ncbi:MAG: hypothetical protein H5U18_15090 [Rhodobacteraceae bacterium]|nr:hypothetical protein [Paracoccaceae bacterium]
MPPARFFLLLAAVILAAGLTVAVVFRGAGIPALAGFGLPLLLLAVLLLRLGRKAP